MRVIGAQLRERGAQQRRIDEIDAGVDFIYFELRRVVSRASTMAATLPSASRTTRP